MTKKEILETSYKWYLEQKEKGLQENSEYGIISLEIPVEKGQMPRWARYGYDYKGILHETLFQQAGSPEFPFSASFVVGRRELNNISEIKI